MLSLLIFRFDFSDQFDAITRENPLSYHNLGLAVTSSFIEPGKEMALDCFVESSGA